MFNILFIVLGIAVLIIPFIDSVLLRDVHKKMLQQKFEAWWKAVEHYDKLRLALVCASKANECLDFTFGHKLLSKKIFVRCSIISTCILIITLSWVGLINKEPFGVTPWKNYTESIKVTVKTIDDLFSMSNLAVFRQLNMTNAPSFHNDRKLETNEMLLHINSNYFIATLTTNAIQSIIQISPLGHGHLTVSYSRYCEINDQTNLSTNMLGKVIKSTNPIDDLSKDAETFKQIIVHYDRPLYIITYSVLYFLILFSANAFLFIVSLAFCRVMLREIVLSGRLVSTASLVIINLIAVFSVCCLVLLFFTILAVPIFWLCIPTIFEITGDSLATLIAYLLSTSFTVWMLSGMSAKLVVLIALLPSIFAGIVGLFSMLAMKWKSAFHFILKSILIRCAEKSPVVVILSTITFISGMLVVLAKHLHILGFL
jgi:hypothetical protein